MNLLGRAPALALPLRRRGAWLIAPTGSWQMASVVGPLPGSAAGRESFEVLTATDELLLVSRPKGERGMRDLRLDSILELSQARSA